MVGKHSSFPLHLLGQPPHDVGCEIAFDRLIAHGWFVMKDAGKMPKAPRERRLP